MHVDVDEPVELAESDADWPLRAGEEIARLRALLPDDVGIEHIGSTAVAGCLAKPIVDLLVGTAPELRESVAHHVEAAGYESLGEAEPGRIYLRRRSPNFNVHVVELDGPLWRDNLLLREHLRRDPGAQARYAEAKRQALANEPRLLGYSRAKSRVLAELLAEARRSTRP
jgi:GrpB-like predicted nucleotidyltransferase (UPF0157 family)